MNLIVDTNIVLSACLKPSFTQKIIFSNKFQLFVPDYSLAEIEKLSEILSLRMGKSKNEFNFLISAISSKMVVVNQADYLQFKEQSLKVLIDETDWPFLALALHLNCPIWSNDNGFKIQNLVKVYSTQELAELL